MRYTNRRITLLFGMRPSLEYIADSKPKGEGKSFPYSLPSVGPGADFGVQAVSLPMDGDALRLGR